MKMSLLSILGITSWVALATLAATNGGLYLGWLFAVSFATLVALICGRKAVSAYALTVSAGVVGMLVGHLAFTFVIPWPAWVGAESRILFQQFFVDHLAQFMVGWAFQGAVAGLGVATIALIARHVLTRDPIARCAAN